MKKFTILLLIVSVLILPLGCGIIPKDVEFGQKKVRAVPEETVYHKEVIKEAADFVARKSLESHIQAVRENSTTNLTHLTYETSIVADSLSGSLGTPNTPWRFEAESLKLKLNSLEAKLDSRLERFKENNNELVNKRIEGTGVIRLNWFVYVGIIIGVILLMWFGIRIYGIFNPAIGVLSGTIQRISARTAGAAVSQIVKGGEDFKTKIEEYFQNPETKEKILELFKQSQMSAQDNNVQKAIKDIT